MTLRIFHALEYVDSSRTKCTPKADPWHLCDIVWGWRVWLSVCVRPCDATRYGLNWIANITETIHDSAKPQSQNQNGLMDWKKFNWNRHSYEIYSCFSSYIYFFSFLFSFYYWNEGILMNISKELHTERFFYEILHSSTFWLNILKLLTFAAVYWDWHHQKNSWNKPKFRKIGANFRTCFISMTFIS